MEYLSIKQTAEKWGISGRRIQRLCAEGRISGATKIGSYWAVPVDAQRPKDGRIKSGKYIKEAQKQRDEGMKVFNNVTDIVRDDMASTMKKGSKVAIAAACFSMYV